MTSGSGLAEKVSRLIQAAGDPSYETLAREIKAAGGPTVSAAYLWQLRTGARDNPTFQHLQALASYFSTKLGLPITLAYFDPGTAVDQPWTAANTERPTAATPLAGMDQDELARQLAERGVGRISARYGQIGTAVLRDVLAVMEQIEAQNTPDEHPDRA
jgi:transcriptional regulator with XRE-family HTH domain